MPVWIPEAAIRAMHAELIREHGGLSGKVTEDALAATLARPKQLEHYTDPAPSLSRFAAAYGFGLSKNHCFSDGNKRIALAAIDVFLQINGYELTAPEPNAVVVMLALAAGEMDESELSDWIERHSQPIL